MKAYIIEVGCYSDRHVLAVASTHEKAEEILEIARNYKHGEGRHSSDTVIYDSDLNAAEITEYELDMVPVFLQQRIYEITYQPTHSAQQYIWTTKLRDHEKDWWTPYKIKEDKDYRGDSFYEIPVIAKNREAALKVANEHIMQYIANQPIIGEHIWTWAEVKPMLRNTPEEIAIFEKTYKGLPENSIIKTTNSEDIEAFEILDNRGIRPIMKPQRFFNVEEVK